jgi:transcription-repair coupling factor (superfamily II helicase)
VGRADRRAYAYLLVPPDTVLSELARKRLAAIREFSDLGAGFRIAALDLELRGAGNLLGGEQSGHIEAVGLDLYVKLLEQTILELRGQEPREGPRAALHLKLEMRIPGGYVPEVHQRMSLYKRLSQVKDSREIDALQGEIRDRYGALPPEVTGLLRYAGLRLRAEALGVAQVDLVGRTLHLRLAAQMPFAPDSLAALVRTHRAIVPTPQGLKSSLPEGQDPLDGLAALFGRLQDCLAVSSADPPPARL